MHQELACFLFPNFVQGVVHGQFAAASCLYLQQRHQGRTWGQMSMTLLSTMSWGVCKGLRVGLLYYEVSNMHCPLRREAAVQSIHIYNTDAHYFSASFGCPLLGWGRHPIHFACQWELPNWCFSERNPNTAILRNLQCKFCNASFFLQILQCRFPAR